MTPPDRDAPARRLVEATIEQIEKHGLAQLTVRSVAAAAGVNIAAVNYYFRSKEALVGAALESTIRHVAQDADEFVARLPDDPERVLGELLGYLFEGTLRYPRISRAHLHEAFIADDFSGTFPTLFSPVVKRLRDAVRKAVPGLDDREAAQRVVAALSAVFFPALFAGFYKSLGALGSANDRLAYVQEIARRALAPAERPTRAPRGRRRSSA